MRQDGRVASGATGDYLIYSDLADWWPMISPPREYTKEAAYLRTVLSQAIPSSPDAQVSVLDLGSGGGHVAVHLKQAFAMTLVDISDQMVAVSRRLNPECEHHVGDMRTIQLGRRFDAVLVHDAIDYIIGAADLRRAINTAAAHCKSGGIAIFVPDYVKDTFAELTGGGGGGADEAGRTASFVERTWDPDPADDWVQADYEFTLHTPGGLPKVVRESHRLSAFSRDTWLSLLAEAGLHQDPGIDLHQPVGQRPANLFATRLTLATQRPPTDS
jgi:SAM-dependent methyltransferase